MSNPKTTKKFYEYSDTSGHPIINEVNYPHCPSWGEDPNVFLVYAKDKEDAFKLAMAHIYDGKPTSKFTGTYAGEKWEGIKCVM